MVKTISKIVEEAMPAVVSIVISKNLEKVKKEMTNEGPLSFLKIGNKKQIIPEEAIDAHGMVEIGGGSGFIIDESGIVITNKHVIADSEAEYTVITNDDQKFGADVLARDPINDVAVLRLRVTSETRGKVHRFPSLTLGDSSKIKLGEAAIAIGNSLGMFRNSVSAGIVSGLLRSIRAQIDPTIPAQEMRGLIQTDAAINPGNSGGPLLDDKGKVIGINAAVVFGAENVSFAIPINAVKRDLEDLKKYGRIKRPLLGLRYLSVDKKMQEKMNLPKEYGALVFKEDKNTAGVVLGSPADKAGIKEGDLILECDGKKIDKSYSIQDILEEKKAGDRVVFKVLREGREFEKKVELTERR